MLYFSLAAVPEPLALEARKQAIGSFCAGRDRFHSVFAALFRLGKSRASSALSVLFRTAPASDPRLILLCLESALTITLLVLTILGAPQALVLFILAVAANTIIYSSRAND